MTLKITSKAFWEGDTIPKQYTADGTDLSPPLEWGSVPEGTQSLALICDDPDAPAKTWTHWLLYNLPPSENHLPEGIPAHEVLQNGARQGVNDFGKIGYGGPAPPGHKPHRYCFTMYALDRQLKLPARATRQQVQAALEGHVLEQGQLMGSYAR